MPEYDVTVTVTHQGRVRARSKQDAEDMVIADSGTHLTDQTDIQVEVVRVQASIRSDTEEA